MHCARRRQCNVFSTGVTSGLVCWELHPWFPDTSPDVTVPIHNSSQLVTLWELVLNWLLFQLWHLGLYCIFLCDILAFIFGILGCLSQKSGFNMTAPWTWFRFRIRMIFRIKDNRSSAFSDDMSCRHCNTINNEWQDHLETCRAF